MADFNCNEGDWVRFMKDGKLYIDVVVYKKADGLGPVYVTIHNGEIRQEEILEWRRRGGTAEVRTP